MTGIKIYTIDSSKMKKIGTAGYKQGQEQAKVYQTQLLDRTGQMVQISTKNKTLLDQIFSIINMNVEVDETSNYILITVDFIEMDKYAICICYKPKESDQATSFTIAYCNCAAESNYDAALKIVNCIRAAS